MNVWQFLNSFSIYNIKKNGVGGGEGGEGWRWCLKLWTEVNPFVGKNQMDR